MSRLALALTVALAAALSANGALASGGYFPPDGAAAPSSASSLRVVLSTTAARIVLWDELRFEGAPSEFAWVLPVHPGARLELSSHAWFTALDAGTAVRVARPRVICEAEPGESSPGCDPSLTCWPSSAPDQGTEGYEWSGSGQSMTPPVQVLDRGWIGPYETVTIHGASETPGALARWLRDHGYAVAPEATAILDAYAAEGMDFIALRLRPGRDTQQMRPVRVISPGGAPKLPLRMIGAGAVDRAALTVYILAEARWETVLPRPAVVDPAVLTWDYATDRSNYAELRAAALGAEGGRGWLASYAQRGALLSRLPDPTGGEDRAYFVSDGSLAWTVGEAYVREGLLLGDTTTAGCLDAFTRSAASAGLVVEPCAPGGECGALGAGEIDARELACGALSDMAVALTGMHPNAVWITKLEADLARPALDRDAVLRRSGEQRGIDSWMATSKTLNLPCATVASSAARSMRAPGLVAFGVAVAAAAWARRRRRRRR